MKYQSTTINFYSDLDFLEKFLFPNLVFKVTSVFHANFRLKHFVIGSICGSIYSDVLCFAGVNHPPIALVSFALKIKIKLFGEKSN